MKQKTKHTVLRTLRKGNIPPELDRYRTERQPLLNINGKLMTYSEWNKLFFATLDMRSTYIKEVAPGVYEHTFSIGFVHAGDGGELVCVHRTRPE